MPDSAAKKVPRNWEIQSQRKGYLRYFNPEIVKLKEELTATEIRSVLFLGVSWFWDKGS